MLWVFDPLLVYFLTHQAYRLKMDFRQIWLGLTNTVLYLESVSENVRLPSLIIKKVKIISFLSDEVFIIHDKDINNFELSEQCFGSGYITRRIRIEVCIELHLDMDTKHCAREFNLIRQYAVCSVPPWSNIHKVAMNFTRSVSWDFAWIYLQYFDPSLTGRISFVPVFAFNLLEKLESERNS